MEREIRRIINAWKDGIYYYGEAIDMMAKLIKQEHHLCTAKAERIAYIMFSLSVSQR